MAVGFERPVVVAGLGVTQIIAWGSTYYLLAVLAKPIAADTGWSLAWVVAGISLGLLVGGLASPTVGRLIQQHGGRPILAAGSALLALGLALLAFAPTLPLYLLAWLVTGLGMGAGLYDAAFATLGRLYGQQARSAITNLTLVAGFSSTICWPLSAYFVEHIGWRGACLSYAAIQLLVCLPLHLVAIPAAAAPAATIRPKGAVPLLPRASVSTFWLLAAILTLGALIAATLSVHLLTILQARGITLVGAVALGALVGPSQIGARVVEMAFGPHYHPIWTMAGSVMLVGIGVGFLLLGSPPAALAVVLYGAGAGIGWIAKGTLPLALFGSANYAALMGRLALPSLLAQALAPSVGALLIENGGPRLALVALSGAAATNIALTATLALIVFKFSKEAPG